MIRFVHTADLHLERLLTAASYPARYSDERREAAWEQLENILTYCNKNELKYLLISGDLYEREYFTPFSIYRLINCFSKFPKINIIIISGNHDKNSYQYISSEVKIPENVYIFEEDELDYIEFKEDKLRFYGLSWKKSSYKELNLAPDLDKYYTNILLLHADLTNRNETYQYIETNKLNDFGFDYVALGHIHSKIQISENIMYPGCPEPMYFWENDDKGFLDVKIDDGILNYDFICQAKRKFSLITLDLEESDNSDSIIKKLSEITDSKNFFRITVTGDVSIELKSRLPYIFKYFETKLFFAEFIDKTSIITDTSIEESNNDLLKRIGEFIKNSRYDDSIKEEAIKKMLTILYGEKYKSED